MVNILHQRTLEANKKLVQYIIQRTKELSKLNKAMFYLKCMLLTKTLLILYHNYQFVSKLECLKTKVGTYVKNVKSVYVHLGEKIDKKYPRYF